MEMEGGGGGYDERYTFLYFLTSIQQTFNGQGH